MDRYIPYEGELVFPHDLQQMQMNDYNALGRLISSILGDTTQVNGFACSPTSPASLSVLIGPGQLYSLQQTDTTVYGENPPIGFPIDPTPMMKQGILYEQTTLTMTAPGTSGYSINYLIQVAFSEVDGDEADRQFVNSVIENVAQQRLDTVILSAKAGSPAPTGTQSTPSPDAGYSGLWVVTIAQGQTTITSGNIAQYSNTVFLVDKLKDKITFAQGDTRYVQLSAPTNHNWFINPVINISQATNSVTISSGTSAYCVDMIKHVANSGTTITASQEVYTVGQAAIPGASFYLRHDQNGASSIQIVVGNVAQFSGQTVTLGVYCSSSANITVGGSYIQNFGQGGSAQVTGTISGTMSVTSTTALRTLQFTLPSITGKTLGPGSATLFCLTMPASSVVMNIYGVSVVDGTVAIMPMSSGADIDLRNCQYWYQTSYGDGFYPGDNTQIGLQQSTKKIYLSGSGGGGTDVEMMYCEVLPKPYNISTSNISIYDAAGNLGKISVTQQNGSFVNNIDYQFNPAVAPIGGWLEIPPSNRNFTFFSNDNDNDWGNYSYHWVVDCRV